MNKTELTEEMIESFKQRLPNRPLFRKDLAGQSYVFTNITREEFMEITEWGETNRAQVRQEDFEDKVVEYALLFPIIEPKDWALMPAGVVPTLSETIQKKSLLGPPEEDIEGINIHTLLPHPESEKLPDKEKEELVKSSKTALTKVTINNKEFVIKPVSRLEFTAIRKMKEEEIENELSKRSTVWPKNVDWANIDAGIPALLSTQVLILSGFRDVDSAEEL